MLFLKSLAFTHFSLCAIQKGIHTNSFLMLHRSHSVSGTRGESGVWKPCRICHLGSFSVFILILLSYKHQALEGESPTWPIFFFFLLSHIASLYVYVTDKTKWNDFLCVWRILLQKKSPSLNQVILRFIWYYCISLYSGGFIGYFSLILVGRILKLFSDKII